MKSTWPAAFRRRLAAERGLHLGAAHALRVVCDRRDSAHTFGAAAAKVRVCDPDAAVLAELRAQLPGVSTPTVLTAPTRGHADRRAIRRTLP